MRIAIVLTGLVLLSVAGASAQERRIVPVPVPRLDNPAAGITEQGRGTSPVTTDRLKLVVQAFGGPGGLRQSTFADEPLPAPGQSPLEKMVVKLMHDNGIEDARVASPIVGNLSANDQILGTILKPTNERVAEIERRVISALPKDAMSSLQSTNVMASLEADDCSAAVDLARAAAFADAKKRAESLAALGGVRLGALLSATESDQTAGCANLGGGPVFVTQNNGTFGHEGLPFDRLDIAVNVTATFAIAP